MPVTKTIDTQDYGLTESLINDVLIAFENKDTNQVTKLVKPLHAGDIADLFEALNHHQREDLVTILGNKLDGEILKYLNPEILVEVTEAMGARKAAQAIARLEEDEAVQVVEGLEEQEQQELFESLPKTYRQALEEGLSFPEDSVGRLMHRKYVSIPQKWNVGQAIDYLRQFNDLPGDFHEVYVVDKNMQPKQMVLLSRIIRNQRDTKIDKISTSVEHILNPEQDQEEGSYIFRQYGLISAPVVNNDGQIIGVVTQKDVIDVAIEEAEEDILKLGGINEGDLFSDVNKTVYRRFPWLFVNLITAFLSALIISMFGATIEQMVTLAALMPVVANMCGNTGTQTLTIAVRAIANKEIYFGNANRVILKEVIVALINGVILGLCGAAISILLFGGIGSAIIFGLSIIISFAIAGFVGTIIPLTMAKLRFDPAIASSPVLFAITDLVSFLIFLGLATMFLL